jgi:hypothetical protein
MNFTAEQIEQIVQRVVQQLGMTNATNAPQDVGWAVPTDTTDCGGHRPPYISCANPVAHSQASFPTQPVKAMDARGVHIAGQVITQSLLAASATGVEDVRIDAKAILTPTARDFVKQHGIRIVREGAAPARATATIRWQALVTKSTSQIAAAIDGLSPFGVVCEVRLSGVPAEAAAQAISALCRAEVQQVVVFSDQPELVACLANRNDKVHAAAASDIAAIERVRRHLQANLLALDPAAKSVHELKTLLKAFRAF